MSRTLRSAHPVGRLHLEQALSAAQIRAGFQDFELFHEGWLEDVVLGRPGQLAGALGLFVAVAAFWNRSEIEGKVSSRNGCCEKKLTTRHQLEAVLK